MQKGVKIENIVTVIGGLNIDHVLSVKELPSRGETLIARDYKLFCGGKGANQAVAIARHGIGVNIIGKVGKDSLGDLLIKSLIESNVDVKDIIIDKNEKTGMAFITVDENGKNTIVVASGANNNLSISDIKDKEDQLLKSNIIVVQMEIPVYIVSYLINFARDMDKLIVLNLSPVMEIDKNILGAVDYLILNEIELENLTDVNFNYKNIDIAIRRLRKFFTKNVVVTLGEKGTIYSTIYDKILKVQPYSAKSIDSTAAGDAFIGGFVLGLVNNNDISSCIHLGNAAGSLAVSKLGAQVSLPYKSELEEFLRTHNNFNDYNFTQ